MMPSSGRVRRKGQRGAKEAETAPKPMQCRRDGPAGCTHSARAGAGQGSELRRTQGSKLRRRHWSHAGQDSAPCSASPACMPSSSASVYPYMGSIQVLMLSRTAVMIVVGMLWRPVTDRSTASSGMRLRTCAQPVGRTGKQYNQTRAVLYFYILYFNRCMRWHGRLKACPYPPPAGPWLGAHLEQSALPTQRGPQVGAQDAA